MFIKHAMNDITVIIKKLTNLQKN